MLRSSRTPPFCFDALPSSVCYPLTTLERSLSFIDEFQLFARGVLKLKSFPVFIVLATLAPSLCFANIGAEWNPTSNPIGGGPGYSDSVTTWDYYVTNATEFLASLSSAGIGDIIYVADTSEIDLSNQTNQILIPGGVTIASGRGRAIDDTISWGGLIYTDRHDTPLNPLLRTYGTNIRFTGLRLRGSDPDIGQMCSPPIYCIMSGIAIFNANCEVDNCEIYEWGYAGVVAGDGASNASIHHNYIHHNRKRGCGYGVVTGDAADVLIEANLFDFYRHAIAASGEPINSYEARYNICMEHGVLYFAFDRHGTGGPTNYGGQSTIAHHNTFWCKTTNYNKAVGISGIPSDTAAIYNNWCYHPDSATAFQLYTNMNCSITDNHFGLNPPPGVEARLPVAVANADIDSGYAPLTVSLSGSGSHDLDGSVAWYEWDLGDGTNRVRRESIAHAFSDIGRYNVVLTIHDNDGIPDRDMIPITVFPTNPDSHYLSFWVKDSYRSNAYPGYYYMRVFVDTHLIWQQDVVGDTGWMHIIRNVTSQVGGKDSVTIELRLQCNHDIDNQEYLELFTYWDDLFLFWGDIRNGDYEAANQGYNQDPVYWVAGHSSQAGGYWGWEVRSGQVRSGSQAWMMQMTDYGINRSGDYVYTRQKVGVNGAGVIPSGGDSRLCSLYMPYPNPAKFETRLSYKLEVHSAVSLNVCDVAGRFVRNIVSGTQMPGEYVAIWDGRDMTANNVANGVYFFRLIAGSLDETRKVVWLR